MRLFLPIQKFQGGTSERRFETGLWNFFINDRRIAHRIAGKYFPERKGKEEHK